MQDNAWYLTKDFTEAMLQRKADEQYAVEKPRYNNMYERVYKEAVKRYA